MERDITCTKQGPTEDYVNRHKQLDFIRPTVSSFYIQ